MRKLDHAGKRFGKLLVLHRSAIKARNAYWICRCDCGRKRAICAGHLTTGKIASCGCVRIALVAAALTKHGHRRGGPGGRQTVEYTAWVSLKDRCMNSRNRGYENYGGRGISVCERWLADFPAFLADMGARPSRAHSIDRIDNNGDYEPGNCRWATKSQQAFNRRPKRKSAA